MPHRTTYFFPRQFPDRGLDPASSKQLLDHEQNQQINKRVASSTWTSTNETFNTERDRKWSKDALFTVAKEDVDISAAPDLFTRGDKLQYAKSKQQFAAFCNWLVERKGERSCHVKSSSSSRLSCVDDEDRELLLPKDVAEPVKDRRIDRNFDRQVSLPRLSSAGSSYSGSLFSGTTTFDGNLSFDIVKDSTATTRQGEEEMEVESKESLAQRATESHYLQLTLARRLASQASLACEPLFMVESTGLVASDAETVSYRLWVNGCLSYTDKISDGFYNILGMNPYLWLMCNDEEEGRRLPPLISLKAVDPSETSMEVVLVDRRGDSRLKELEDKAQELYCASENTLMLVEKLGKLVAIYMGGSFPVEQGDLHMRWKVVSKRMREFQKCIVLPIGSLSMGLCRHRAILFKVGNMGQHPSGAPDAVLSWVSFCRGVW